ncbi:TRAP transporter substrate-binding protein DctP [Thermodesulfobacteriota bacterium]
MKRIILLMLIVSILIVIPLSVYSQSATKTGNKDYIEWKPKYWIEKPLKFEKGAKVKGMKPGEENLYFKWKAGYPPAGPDSIIVRSTQWVMNEIFKQTKGHLIVDVHYGHTLGKTTTYPGLVGAGAFEVANMVPLYHSEWTIGHAPAAPFFAPADVYQSTQFYHYAWTHPVFLKHTNKLNLHTFYTRENTPYYLYSTIKSEKIADFKGHLFAGQGLRNVFAEGLGMSLVEASTGKVYEMFQRNMVQFSLYSLMGGYQNYRWYEVAKYILDYPVTASGSVVCVNKNAWDNLPHYIRNLVWKIQAEGLPATAARFLNENEAKMRKGLIKEGVEFYSPSAEVKKGVLNAASLILKTWLKDCENRGYGDDAKKYLIDLIAYRDKITGKPWEGYRP